jgi:hypothetical protein
MKSILVVLVLTIAGTAVVVGDIAIGPVGLWTTVQEHGGVRNVRGQRLRARQRIGDREDRHRRGNPAEQRVDRELGIAKPGGGHARGHLGQRHDGAKQQDSHERLSDAGALGNHFGIGRELDAGDPHDYGRDREQRDVDTSAERAEVWEHHPECR